MLFRTIPQSWLSYRCRNRVAVALLVVGFPLVVALAIGVKVLLSDASEFFFVGAVVVWCAAWGCAAFRVARWPCPRCGQPWLSNQEPQLGARRACKNCGLGLYEAP
jgi:predicted RNA-binding Zn-ribbon protein involved in translation (DUF1610 family)